MKLTLLQEITQAVQAPELDEIKIDSAVGTTWSKLSSRVATISETFKRSPVTPAAQINNLAGLLKLQVDLGQYQLQVELVSKVSESAVASLRKLQQNG